jgi:hypothetical protein
MATIETYTEIILDMLTTESVSVLTREFADINGVKTQIGTNMRKAYVNSPMGREMIAKELPEEYVNTVLTLWGETATIQDPPKPEENMEV